MFSDRSTRHSFRYPYYDYFRDTVEPVVRKVGGSRGLLSGAMLVGYRRRGCVQVPQCTAASFVAALVVPRHHIDR